jgi:hypothetical protein
MCIAILSSNLFFFSCLEQMLDYTVLGGEGTVLTYLPYITLRQGK